MHPDAATPVPDPLLTPASGPAGAGYLESSGTAGAGFLDSSGAAAPGMPSATDSSAPARRLSSAELLGSAREIEISHGDALYRLRLTSLGKLILTK
jgi:hemin uptake protein HemP